MVDLGDLLFRALALLRRRVAGVRNNPSVRRGLRVFERVGCSAARTVRGLCN